MNDSWNGGSRSRSSRSSAPIGSRDFFRRKLPISSCVSDDEPLESHRREVAVVFCDLRGFTAFAEIAEPEEVRLFCGSITRRSACLSMNSKGRSNASSATACWFCSTIRFLPGSVPARCENGRRHAGAAQGARSPLARLRPRPRFRGRIAYGYATLGSIGFEGRSDYSAIGTVVNLAARLCAEAGDGHILVDSKVRAAIENAATLEPAGDLALKGLHRVVPAFHLHTIA